MSTECLIIFLCLFSGPVVQGEEWNENMIGGPMAGRGRGGMPMRGGGGRMPMPGPPNQGPPMGPMQGGPMQGPPPQMRGGGNQRGGRMRGKLVHNSQLLTLMHFYCVY